MGSRDATIIQHKLVYASTKPIKTGLLSNGSFPHCNWFAHPSQRLKTVPARGRTTANSNLGLNSFMWLVPNLASRCTNASLWVGHHLFILYFSTCSLACFTTRHHQELLKIRPGRPFRRTSCPSILDSTSTWNHTYTAFNSWMAARVRRHRQASHVSI